MKILLFFVLAVALFGVMATSVSAEEKVPSWIKNTAGWWATDSISETEFVNAIQFLVNDGIINTKIKFSSEKDIEKFFEKEISFITKDKLEAEINSQGLRGTEFSIDKPNDVFRIIAVGGSTTFGHGVEDGWSWPALLQESLNELEPLKKIEVLNAGVSGATTLQNMKHINQKLIIYHRELRGRNIINFYKVKKLIIIITINCIDFSKSLIHNGIPT